MTAARIRIGVVGGGVGGLTLALALRRRGLEVDVYEQASELREIGAAVALSANATRELDRLGCLEAIAVQSCEPSELIWRGWRDGGRVASFPVAKGGAYRTRFGAPYFGIHRADLQRVLGGAYGSERLHLGHGSCASPRRMMSSASTSPTDTGPKSMFSLARTACARPCAISSPAENGRLFRHERLPRHCSCRDLPSLPDPQALQFWMGPNAHLLHYAIGPSGGHVNFFAVVEGPRTWAHDAWIAPAGPDEAAKASQAGIRPWSRWSPPCPIACGGACSPSGRCQHGGADAPCCSATPRMACCRIMGRARTLHRGCDHAR